ncbi:hypothetical protein ES703_26081 [subsurface metagenome]
MNYMKGNVIERTKNIFMRLKCLRKMGLKILVINWLRLSKHLKKSPFAAVQESRSYQLPVRYLCVTIRIVMDLSCKN